MDIILENKKLQKKTTFNVPDEFYTDAEDMLITVGLEQFKLASTKSKEDIIREKLAIAFGDEVFNQIFTVFPDFGIDEQHSTDEAVDSIKKIIKAKLEANPKYKPLVDDKHPDTLLHCLVTAYKNYCVVRRTMDKKNKEIEDSTLDKNIFFDYILRFKQLFASAKTLLELFNGISKIHEYAQLDTREIYGYAEIFHRLRPFFLWIDSIEKELHTMKPYKPIKEQPFSKDESYLNDHRDTLSTCVAQLNDLYLTYRDFEKKTTSQNESPFINYLDKLIILFKEWVTLKEQLDDECHKKVENKLCDIDGKAKEWNDCYHRMLIVLIEIRIKLNLDKRPWKTVAEKNTIDANISIVDYWNTELNKVAGNARAQVIERMCSSLKTNISILEKLKSGELDPEMLMNKEYTKYNSNQTE